MTQEDDVNKNGIKKIWVGQFFEHATKEVTGGELTRNEDGDVSDRRYAVLSEVKARSRQASRGFPLDTDQIDRYALSVGSFPWETWKQGLYWFYAYNNPSKRVGRKSSTALSHHKTEAAVREYLTKNMLWCVVVDLTIVAHWRGVRPVVTGSIQSHENTPTIDIRHRDLEHLVNGGFREELTKYDLDPERFEVLGSHVSLDLRPTLFERYNLSFPLTAVLLKEHVSTAQRIFKRRGFPLRRRDD